MAYSPKLWTKIQSEYESGKYSSIEELYEKLRKTTESMPTLESIQDKCTDQGWKRTRAQQSLKDKYREAFLKRNFDENKVAEIVTLMGEAMKPSIIPSNQTDKDGNKEPGMAMEIEDWVARDKAITQFAKLTGSYAPEQREIVTPEKVQRLILGIGEIINRLAPDNIKQQLLTEIAQLMEKIDNGESYSG